jgi:hypothetical protein
VPRYSCAAPASIPAKIVPAVTPIEKPPPSVRSGIRSGVRDAASDRDAGAAQSASIRIARDDSAHAHHSAINQQIDRASHRAAGVAALPLTGGNNRLP